MDFYQFFWNTFSVFNGLKYLSSQRLIYKFIEPFLCYLQLFKHDPQGVLDFWAWVNKHAKVGVPFMRGYYNLPMPYRKWVASPQNSPSSWHKIIVFVNTILKVHLTYTGPVHFKLLHYLPNHTNFKRHIFKWMWTTMFIKSTPKLSYQTMVYINVNHTKHSGAKKKESGIVKSINVKNLVFMSCGTTMVPNENHITIHETLCA